MSRRQMVGPVYRIFFIVIFSMPFLGNAQAPSFSVSDFSCDLGFNERGFFGSITYQGESISASRCSRQGTLLRRQTNRERKAAREANDTAQVAELSSRFNALRNIQKQCRRCRNYRSPNCSNLGVNDPVGDTATEKPTISEACSVVVDPQNAGAFPSDGRSLRVANGRVCQDAATSPVVELQYQGRILCSGVLISDTKVLTAAHCFGDRVFERKRRAIRRLTVLSADNTSREVINFRVNPLWPRRTTEKSDTAIVTLAEPFEGIAPATIYRGDEVGVSDVVVITGYGQSETGFGRLRATANTIENLSRSGIETIYNFGQSDEGSSCVGDSGSPLFVFKGGEWQVAGILSRGGPSEECLLDDDQFDFDLSVWANLNGRNHFCFIDKNL